MINSQLSGRIVVFVVLVDFCSVNTPTWADFKLLLDWSWEKRCTIDLHESTAMNRSSKHFIILQMISLSEILSPPIYKWINWDTEIRSKLFNSGYLVVGCALYHQVVEAAYGKYVGITLNRNLSGSLSL